MGETIAQVAQNLNFIGALIGALFVIIAVVAAYAIATRRTRPAGEPVGVVAPEGLEPVVEPVEETNLDERALSEAVHEAESRGERDRLPVLYLALARSRLEAGAAAEAEELFRQCIRAAVGAADKSVHGKARLALGDLAHAAGDPTTACEHWQIARAVFHEIDDKHEHAQAESRMLANGCPTDWVLTDF